jgi:hypothetical protein
MLQVFVSPNPLAPSTSIDVSWSFDPDEIPDAVIIMEFDASGNQITSTGQIAPIPGGPVLFSALKRGAGAQWSHYFVASLRSGCRN